jgi:hypothetical protein
VACGGQPAGQGQVGVLHSTGVNVEARKDS